MCPDSDDIAVNILFQECVPILCPAGTAMFTFGYELLKMRWQDVDFERFFNSTRNVINRFRCDVKTWHWKFFRRTVFLKYTSNKKIILQGRHTSYCGGLQSSWLNLSLLYNIISDIKVWDLYQNIHTYETKSGEGICVTLMTFSAAAAVRCIFQAWCHQPPLWWWFWLKMIAHQQIFFLMYHSRYGLWCLGFAIFFLGSYCLPQACFPRKRPLGHQSFNFSFLFYPSRPC